MNFAGGCSLFGTGPLIPAELLAMFTIIEVLGDYKIYFAAFAFALITVIFCLADERDRSKRGYRNRKDGDA